MGKGLTVKNILYTTVHRNKKTIDQIADEIGVSANSLYKYCYENEAGVDMPLSRMLPLMNATKNYSLLKHIAHLAGFVLVKIPKLAISKKDEFDIIDEYQSATVVSIKTLKDFFNDPTQENYSRAKESLLEVMERCAQNTKYIDKKIDGQFDLEL